MNAAQFGDLNACFFFQALNLALNVLFLLHELREFFSSHIILFLKCWVMFCTAVVIFYNLAHFLSFFDHQECVDFLAIFQGFFATRPITFDLGSQVIDGLAVERNVFKRGFNLALALLDFLNQALFVFGGKLLGFRTDQFFSVLFLVTHQGLHLGDCGQNFV